ncbi:FAD-dependent monooxygenase [Pantoea vagans]|uniref:FAD-dependent monooxygenase n=1 Tax=Pantoea vagans TaxID=470934 RepID=UPI0023B106D0|nr:FAD-dependent monooxygenase [Pantoea vagans]MDE8559426.1 FAD-dependent monooxygenase [Pantoea vagans]MDE8579418.1 FAD-dependent monooxygenase [Pantoea vagans]
MALFPLSEGHFRLIADNPSHGIRDAAPTLAEIQETYDQRSAIPARFHDMTWSSWFRINSRMVNHLRVGQLFLGGDAAHIHAPAGAQGMNTGMQDMVNLC